jgi:putative ABC transport system substrate-binding protein
MRRRHFLAALGGAAVAWPRATVAKAPARIGFLASGAAASINSAYQIRTIQRGLADSGLIEGRDYLFEPRFAAGQQERFAELARDLAEAGVSLVLADTAAAVRAAQHLAPRVPVVMVSIDDPVGAGLVAGLAGAGGATTGTATLNRDLAPRMLEFQRMVLPTARSIAVLYDAENPADTALPGKLRERAGALGLSLLPLAFQSREQLEAAFRGLAARPPDALQVVTDSATCEFIDRISALALANRLPAFANTPEFAGFGCLMAYGASREQRYLRTGTFVKQILDGENPGGLPVDLPSRNELWINLRTARALDITMPAALLGIADQVVE